MQLLSLAVLGPEAQRLAEEWARGPALDYGRLALVLGGLFIALWIVSAWLGSQLVTKDKTEFVRALKTGFQWSVMLAIVGALAGSAFYFAKLSNAPAMVTASLAIGVVLGLYVGISVPMKVYAINFFQALGLFLAALVIHAAAQVAIQKVTGDSLGLGPRIAQFRHFLALPPADAAGLLAAQRGPAPSTAPAVTTPAVPDATPVPTAPAKKTIAERHAALKEMYADILALHAQLKEGDEAGLAKYSRDTARYQELLSQLQKEAAAEPK